MCGYNKEDWTELSQMAEVRSCYSFCLSVCRPLVTTVNCGKTTDWIRMPFGMVDCMGPSNDGVEIPHTGMGFFFGGGRG